MNRSSAIALGLSALVVGAVTSTIKPQVSSRSLPASTARRVYAVRADISIKQAPNASSPTLGTLGQGSSVLVGDAEGAWYPIVREWVEDNVRFARNLGFLLASDVSFTKPAVTSSLTAAASAPNPAEGRSDGGECDELFHFAGWPSQVDDFKRRLNTVFEDTDVTARACAGLTDDQKGQWEAFLSEWRAFADKATPTFGSYGDWKTACTYAKQLDGWRNETLKNAQCKFVGPSSIHGYDVPAGAQIAFSSAATIVKWGMLGLGGIVLFTTFYPEIRSALTLRRSMKRAA